MISVKEFVIFSLKHNKKCLKPLNCNITFIKMWHTVPLKKFKKFKILRIADE